MITWELILNLALFNFIMYVTPGPNNSILTASGIKFGFVKTLPNIFGIPTGHGLQLALVCFGLGSLFIKFPFLLDVLKYVGAIYILYLSYKMLGSLKVSEAEDKSRPLKYYEAILFQAVNPKAWIICITAVTSFYPDKENIIIATIFMVVMSTIINIPSISIWALFGSLIKIFLKNYTLKISIEYLLAIILIITALNIVFPDILYLYFFEPIFIKPFSLINIFLSN